MINLRCRGDAFLCGRCDGSPEATIIFFGKRLAEKAGWDIAHATAHLRLIIANTTLERGCSRWYDYSPWLSFSSAA